LNGSTIKDIAPVIFACVRARKRRATVAEALNNHNWVRHITGPLTMQVLLEFDHLCDLLENVHLFDVPDTFCWSLTAYRAYTAASTYGAMFLGSSMPLGAKQIWKTSAPPRVRFFFWLVMHGRCWTAERRFRHGLQYSATCIICDQGIETMEHILLGCCFSREVWDHWLRKLHLQEVIVVQEEPVMQWWLRCRKLVPKAARRGFDSLFFLIGWLIWKERNTRTFGRDTTSPVGLQVVIQEEIHAWCLAGYKHLRSLMAET